ncbi:MAG: hypothetical protein F4X34_02865 [Chloroflexi bacterium]|nr:hypothetical protein [Chloroflexota bacterium]
MTTTQRGATINSRLDKIEADIRELQACVSANYEETVRHFTELDGRLGKMDIVLNRVDQNLEQIVRSLGE